MRLPLPDHRQEKDWSCGRAILEAFHIYWDRPLPLLLSNLTNAVQGLSPETMDAALRASRFDVFSGSMTVPILRSLTREGLPVGCLVQYEGTGHWVLVGGVERGRVHLLCPLRGLLSERVADWNRIWRDCHFLGGEFKRWGVVPFREE